MSNKGRSIAKNSNFLSIKWAAIVIPSVTAIIAALITGLLGYWGTTKPIEMSLSATRTIEAKTSIPQTPTSAITATPFTLPGWHKPSRTKQTLGVIDVTGSAVKIPAINVFAPIVQGTDEDELLRKGIWQVPQSRMQHEDNQLILAGHNDTYGELFRDLDKLKPGDSVFVYSDQGVSVEYIVNQTVIVEKNDQNEVSNTPSPVVILMAAYPYNINSEMILVKASMK